MNDEMTNEHPPTQAPAPMEISQGSANEQVVQCYSQLAKELKEAFPQVPARSFDRRACVLAKSMDEWVEQQAKYFNNYINEYMNEAIQQLTEQKQMEDKDVEVSNKIVEYASETISRIERLAKIIPQIEKTLQAKNVITHQLEFLEQLRERVDKINLSESLKEAEEQAISVMALLGKIN